MDSNQHQFNYGLEKICNAPQHSTSISPTITDKKDLLQVSVRGAHCSVSGGDRGALLEALYQRSDGCWMKSFLHFIEIN